MPMRSNSDYLPRILCESPEDDDLLQLYLMVFAPSPLCGFVEKYQRLVGAWELQAQDGYQGLLDRVGEVFGS